MARGKKGAAKAYGWDRALGGLGFLFSLLGLALGGLMAYWGAKDTKANADLLKQAAWLKSFGGLPAVGAMVIALALVHLAVYAGIFGSRRWAFVVGALLAGYHLGMGGYGFGGFLLTYTVLRLGQVFGPALR